MAAPSIDPSTRPRPRPAPPTEPTVEATPQRPTRRWGRRQDPVQAAGTAIVTAAKVGRILSRSGWRIARQLPGVAAVEQQATRAVQEVTRRISAEEERAARLAAGAAYDPAPLRTAMTELLERSSGANPALSRDYLFGTIMSQLVPDEARILAALAAGGPFAAIDVVAHQDARTVLGNVSTVATVAGIGLPARGSTYLDRLDGFGLLEFGPPTSDADYAQLVEDRAVRSAVRGGARLERKSITLSSLGREFWAASSPSRA